MKEHIQSVSRVQAFTRNAIDDAVFRNGFAAIQRIQTLRDRNDRRTLKAQGGHAIRSGSLEALQIR